MVWMGFHSIRVLPVFPQQRGKGKMCSGPSGAISSRVPLAISASAGLTSRLYKARLRSFRTAVFLLSNEVLRSSSTPAA